MSRNPGSRASGGGALRHRDFRLFWAARAISVAGDRISLLALPTVAILLLGASSAEVGLLNAMGRCPLDRFLGVSWGQALSARLGERTGVAIALVIAALTAGSSALAMLGGRSFNRLDPPARTMASTLRSGG